jgi:hypothetical protein
MGHLFGENLMAITIDRENGRFLIPFDDKNEIFEYSDPQSFSVSGGELGLSSPGIDDNFDDDAINTNLWRSQANYGLVVAQTMGKVRISGTGTFTGGVGRLIGWNSIVSQDWSVDLDFSALALPHSYGSGRAGIAFFSGTYPETSDYVFELYRLSDNDGAGWYVVKNTRPGSVITYRIATSAAEGKIKVAKVGAFFRGYYQDGDSNWIQIGKEIYTSITQSFRYCLDVFVATHFSIDIRFDNFIVTRGESSRPKYYRIEEGAATTIPINRFGLLRWIKAVFRLKLIPGGRFFCQPQYSTMGDILAWTDYGEKIELISDLQEINLWDIPVQKSALDLLRFAISGYSVGGSSGGTRVEEIQVYYLDKGSSVVMIGEDSTRFLLASSAGGIEQPKKAIEILTERE